MIAILLLAALVQEPPSSGGQAPPPVPPPAPAAAAPASAPQSSDEFAKEVFFGKKFADLKDYAEAYNHFAKADQMQPDNPAVLYDMAAILAKAGRYSEAQTKVDRYMQLFPNGSERATVAKLQLELEFQRELQKKRQADENYLEMFNRGKFLYAKADYDGALKVFQDAEQQRPNDASAVFNQAVIYEKMNALDKAEERFRRYGELESDPDAKQGIDQRLLMLESELDDIKTKIVCAFCGYKLPANATWCPRCWHGPYMTSSAIWSSRPCVDGATATRAMYYSDGRFAKNDTLPCLYSAPLREALRYTPSRQKAIQDARKSEGWTYTGDVIQSLADRVKYMQGAQYLERIVSPPTGEFLDYAAHQAGDGTWLLDREALIIDGQKYTARYTFDASNRVSQEEVDYQNAAACDHLISMNADYTYGGDALQSVKIHGGYDGFSEEGSPRVDWDATVAYTYDASGRLTKEDLALASMQKVYAQKPNGPWRDELNKIYTGWHAKKPIENIMRSGDLCGTNGNLVVGNAIDLRPFYLMSPNTSMLLPFGVTKASVSFTYPDAYQSH